jgi:nicotinamidase-related amidase
MVKIMDTKKESLDFAGYLENWFAKLPSLQLSELVKQPQKTAVISVDMINGFCYAGPLSSPRVAGIVKPIIRLFSALHSLGLKNFVLTQDTHEPNAVEFSQWPAHCVSGTTESETIKEFKELPFFSDFTIFPKNSTNSAINTGLPAWIEQHPQIDTFIVVGDCTDLCIYQLAMYLRLEADARQLKRRVIVPENCVQTFDIPVETAIANHLTPHPGDLIHAQFLYHMFLNGVEVIKNLE